MTPVTSPHILLTKACHEDIKCVSGHEDKEIQFDCVTERRDTSGQSQKTNQPVERLNNQFYLFILLFTIFFIVMIMWKPI